MPNLKKQVMDLKWLLERSSDIITTAQLDRIKDTLLKADVDYNPDDDIADVSDTAGLTEFDPNAEIDDDDAGSAYLKEHTDTSAPSEDVQAAAPVEDAPAKASDLAPTKVSSQEKGGLHQIHHDNDYRSTLKDYAKNYLQGEYSKIIRDAEASDNPDKATTGHAYHLANPQHGMDLTRKIADLQNDPSHKDLSPREQHQQLAQAQGDHFSENPNHKDEFVASGRERNEYAQAAKQVRADKRTGEREDIGRGGTTGVTDMSGGTNEQIGQQIGAAATEQGSQANIQLTPEARAAGSSRTASKVYERETLEANKKKLMDMMSHNADNGGDDPMHAKRQDRMKGISPAAAQSLIESTAGKMGEKREASTQQAVADRSGKEVTSSDHPSELLAREYIPKMNSMAAKMLQQYGKVASNIQPQDLSRQGAQGMWEAVRDFDHKTHNFKGLMARRIKARMRDELNKQVNVSKPTQQDVKRIENAQRIMQEQDKTKKEGE